MTRTLLFLLFIVLLVASLLGYDTSLAPGLSGKNAFLYLLCAALAIETAVTRNRSLELASVLVPFGLFVAYGVLTWVVVVLFIDYLGFSLMDSLISLKGGLIDRFLVFAVFFYGVLSVKDAHWLLRVMLWAIIASNVVTVVDILNVPDLGRIAPQEDGRLAGPLGDANSYGVFLAAFLPAAVALYLTAARGKRLLAAAGAFTTFAALLMTASRGAVVGLLAGLVVGAFYLRRYISARVMVRAALALAFCAVVASVALFALGYGELLYDRFVVAQQRTNIQDISSARTVFWAIALGKMLEFPVTFITGFGWSVYEQWDIFRYATHNSYLNILFNLGFIGLTLFVTVAVTTAAAARRALAHAPPDLAPHLIAFVFGFLTVFAAIFFGELSTPWIFIWAYAGVTMRLAVAIPATKPVAASYVKAKLGGVTGPAGMPVAWKRTN